MELFEVTSALLQLALPCFTLSDPHYTTLQYNTIQYNTMQYNTLPYPTLPYPIPSYSPLALPLSFRYLSYSLIPLFPSISVLNLSYFSSIILNFLLIICTILFLRLPVVFLSSSFQMNYYPPELTDWWMDDWISLVYGMSRTFKAADVRVLHHTGEECSER